MDEEMVMAMLRGVSRGLSAEGEAIITNLPYKWTVGRRISHQPRSTHTMRFRPRAHLISSHVVSSVTLNTSRDCVSTLLPRSPLLPYSLRYSGP